ncbi:hypothetical protein T484DRAFT_1940347, partial [Baffinella frigidus]
MLMKRRTQVLASKTADVIEFTLSLSLSRSLSLALSLYQSVRAPRQITAGGSVSWGRQTRRSSRPNVTTSPLILPGIDFWRPRELTFGDPCQVLASKTADVIEFNQSVRASEPEAMAESGGLAQALERSAEKLGLVPVRHTSRARATRGGPSTLFKTRRAVQVVVFVCFVTWGHGKRDHSIENACYRCLKRVLGQPGVAERREVGAGP